MYTHKYMRVLWRVFGLLLCGLTTNAHATFEIVNYTAFESVEQLKSNVYDELYSGNSYFKGMIRELHENSDLSYKMIFVDASLYPDLDGDAKVGFVQRGGFIASSDAWLQFDVSMVEKYPMLAKVNAINDLRFGHNLIMLYMQSIPVGDRSYYGVHHSTLLQETFHALQYEFYQDHQQPDYFNNVDNLAALEVESELSNYLFQTPDRKDSLRHHQMANMKGFKKIVLYFIGVAIGQPDDPKQLAVFDNVLDDVWKFMTEHMGYSSYINGKKINTDVNMEDLKTLHWFMKNHLF